MVKKIVALAITAAVAVSIVGCGPSDNGKKPGEVDTSKWEGMELTVAGYRQFNDDPLNYEFAAGAEKFVEKYKTKDVNFIVGGGNGMDDDLVASIVAGTPWDLQYAFGISIFPVPLAKNLFTPITDYLDLENPYLDKEALEGAKWKGEYYGVSNLGMQEFSYASYNETWFKELGVKTPIELYNEGNWTTESFMNMVAELKQKNVNVQLNVGRPNVTGMYLCKWNDDDTVTVTYDSQENQDWLNMWRKLMYEPEYQVGVGTVADRQTIFSDDVFPNVIKNEVSKESSDTLRYIHFPQNGNKAGTYLTDSHFLVPMGVKEDKIAAAVELAAYMCNEKAVLAKEMYKKNMTEEDYALMEENLANAYFIPRFFTPTLYGDLSNKWIPDAQSGKPVSTHIAENIEWLKSLADEFNNTYAKGEVPELTAPPATQAAQ